MENRASTRIIGEKDEVKIEVTWYFRNLEVVRNAVFSETLMPYADCDCYKFRHPKHLQLKLKKCASVPRGFELYLLCVPNLPLISATTYEPSNYYRDWDKGNVITEHYKDGWQHIRTIVGSEGTPNFITITLLLNINKNIPIGPIQQVEGLDTINELCDDMEELLKEGTDSDVTLLSEEGTPFKVHQLVLRTRSKVFKAMFNHDQDTEIQTSYKENVLREVLKYLYTGKTLVITDMAREVLVAADYYQLDSLKTACVKIVHEKLTPDNAIETLEFANQYNFTGLLESTLQYIKNGHADYVVHTEGWKNIKSLYLVKRMFEVTNSSMQKCIYEVSCEGSLLDINCHEKDFF